MSDATGDEHSFDATSDFPTAVGPAITMTNGLYCCCLFVSLSVANAAELSMLLLVDMRGHEAGFSRFLEFIRNDIDGEEKADDEDFDAANRRAGRLSI